MNATEYLIYMFGEEFMESENKGEIVTYEEEDND